MRLCVSLLALLLVFQTSAAQKNFHKKEKELVAQYERILPFIQEDYDSILKYSEQFADAFYAFLKSNPSTIEYPFRLLDSVGVWVNTSSDGNLRIYSWDSWTGGTMHDYYSIYQWKSNGKVHLELSTGDEGDAGSFCEAIHTIQARNQTFYLVVEYFVGSTKDHMESVIAYTIKNGKLINQKLFKTKTEVLDRIDIAFYFFTVVDRPERPLQLIRYDKKTKTLLIPVVDGEKVTDRYIVYQLKNGYLTFTGFRK